MTDLPRESGENQSGDNSKRNLMPTLYPGMNFTGVIDGEVPGGYLITITGGNGLNMQGRAFFSSQMESRANVNVPMASPTTYDHNNQEMENDHSENRRNQRSRSSFGRNKTPRPLEFEIEDEFDSDYSDFEMPPSPGPDVPDLLLATNKFAPFVLKQVDPLTGTPINTTKSHDKGKQIAKDHYTPNPKEYNIGIDPFLPRKFPSPVVCIRPPCDGVQNNFSAQPDSMPLNRNTSQRALLKNNQKVVLSAGRRKRNVSTEILGTQQFARLSHLGSLSLNRNTSQDMLRNYNEKSVHSVGIRKRNNVSTKNSGPQQYARLSHPGSSSLNRNTGQDVSLNNNEKFVHSASIRKRNFSTEILDTEKYARLSHPGSLTFNQNPSQHALLKNNEKVVRSQPGSSNLTDMMNSFFAARHQKGLMRKHFSGGEGSSIQQQANKCFIDLDEENDDDDDDEDTQTDSSS